MDNNYTKLMSTPSSNSSISDIDDDHFEGGGTQETITENETIQKDD